MVEYNIHSNNAVLMYFNYFHIVLLHSDLWALCKKVGILCKLITSQRQHICCSDFIDFILNLMPDWECCWILENTCSYLGVRAASLAIISFRSNHVSSSDMLSPPPSPSRGTELTTRCLWTRVRSLTAPTRGPDPMKPCPGARSEWTPNLWRYRYLCQQY